MATKQAPSEKTISIITETLAPLRESIVIRATEILCGRISRTYDKLSENGCDLEAAFPHPSGRLNRRAYLAASEYRNFAEKWTVRADENVQKEAAKAAGTSYQSMKAPLIVRLLSKEELATRVSTCANKEADDILASYIHKMAAKVVEHFPGLEIERAEYRGSGNPWSHSFIALSFTDGTTGTLKTQMIINVSPLGTPFNQFPTCKVG